jgi:uncharacterized delta-60 repeat protein
MLRLNANGTLDNTFGGDGLVDETPFSNLFDERFADVVIQQNEKIVAVGYGSGAPNNTSQIGLARYNPDGSLDTSFGNAGTTLTLPITEASDSAFARATTAALDSQGRSIVGGQEAPSNAVPGYAVYRYK